jgi:drug/metabolite transporter (DMT)-like permease
LNRADQRGVALMCAAMGCFVVNDAMMKWAGQHLPFGQLVFTRGVFAMVWIWLATLWLAQPLTLRSFRDRKVWWRSVIEAAGSAAFILSLMHLPLANATAINMAVPLVITCMAALWLKVAVTARQAVAVVVGFAGVMLVIQPATSGFTAYAWLCLAATLCHAMRDLITRGVDRDVPSLHITFSGALAVTLVAGAVMAFQGHVSPSAVTLAVLVGASMFLSLGYYCVIACMRTGDVAVVTPFRYSGLLFAVVLGWALWGTLPNAMAWCGIALLVASGVYLLRAPKA